MVCASKPSDSTGTERIITIYHFMLFWAPLILIFLLLTDLLLYTTMLDSMFDDVKRMDKRQFLYQVFLYLNSGEFGNIHPTLRVLLYIERFCRCYLLV